MLNDLTLFILSSKKANPVLPLMHTTDAYRFREIIRKGKLEPHKCKVFEGEYLFYLFYGRPAYKINTDGMSTSQSMRFPVCFLIKSNYVKIAKRVFPFDSGAFNVGMFKDNIHESMELTNFLVDPDPSKPGQIPTPETPARIVSTFFETNRKYYDLLPKDQLEIDPLHFEVAVFFDWIKSKQKTAADARRSSIEIQIEETIELSEESVEAIVVPTILLESAEVKDAFKKLNAVPLMYEMYHGDPANFTMSIHEEVKKYLEKRKLYV